MDMTLLLNMFQISDSLFPIGSFTLSNGLETFVQKEKLETATDLKTYVKNYVSFMPYNELGVYFLLNNSEISKEKIIEIDGIYSAIKSSREIREGSKKLCSRFIKLWEKIEKLPSLECYSALIKEGICEGHHSIAVALFVYDKGIDKSEGASIYAYSVVSGIITNAVKLVPLSQIDGQLILNDALNDIGKAVLIAKKVKKEELGICGAGFEIYSYNHETLYSRLYMS